VTRTLAVAVALAVALAAGAGPAVAAPSRAALERRLADARDRLDKLQEQLPDDADAMGGFTLFDECAFTIPTTVHDDYWFGGHGHRSALSFDLSATAHPRYALLAFPSEEPPGIECNEDAEPENTDSG
jgi:hypothetical protein